MMNTNVKVETIETLMDRGLSPAKAESLARQMVALGDKLEASDISHRAIDPSMILVDSDGQLKLKPSSFETSLHSVPESQDAEKRWRELAALGEGYRPAAWVWNDRFALMRCIEALPDFSAKAEVLFELKQKLPQSNRPVLFRKRFLWRMLLLGRFAAAKKTPPADARLDELVDKLKEAAWKAGINLGRLVIVGSTPLNAYGVRRCGDVDFVLDGDYAKLGELDVRLSVAEKDLDYYTVSKEKILYDPQYHFRYRGIKIISLDVLKGFKETRRNGTKDADDRRHVIALQASNFYRRWASMPYCWLRLRNWAYRKERIDGVKTVWICGIKRRKRRKM